MSCQLRLALGAILLCASSLTAAVPRDDDSLRAYQHAIGSARAALRNDDSSTAKDLVRDLIPTLERHRKATSGRAVAHKLSQLEALAHEIESAPANAHRNSRDAAAVASSRPTLLIDGKSPGNRCHSALGLTEGESLSVALGRKGSANDEVWLQWRAPAAGQYVFVGSSNDADPMLSAFADCADKQAAAENDDNHGLDAQLVLEATYPGQAWYLKASNGGEAGTIGVMGNVATTISGRVTSAATGAPIQGIEVVARAAVGSDYRGNATTGADGTYTISVWSVDAGGYSVRTGEYPYESPNYVHEAWDNVPCTHANAFYIAYCGTVTAIDVAPGQAQTGIDFELSTGGELSGRVLNEQTGEPVPGAHVTILDGPNSVMRSLTTDAAGRYRTQGIAVDTIYAHVASSQYRGELYNDIACDAYYYCSLTDATPIALSSGQPTRIDFNLTPLAYIEVDLSLGGSSDFSSWGTTLSLFHANGAAAQVSAEHIGNNRYRIGPVQPGNYLLQARTSASFGQWYPGVDCPSDCNAEQAQATPILVASPGSRVLVAMDLHPLPALRGRITNVASGQPVASAYISLFRNSNDYPLYTTAIDSDGYYELPAVDTGEYLVAVEATGFVDQLYSNIECEFLNYINGCDPAPTITFGLTSGDRAADFALRPSPKVTGHFYSGNLPLPNGATYWDSVRLVRGNLSYVEGTSLQIDAVAGSYTVSDFSAGNYFVYAQVGGYFPQVADDKDCSFQACPWAQARSYAVGAADTQVDFHLTPRGRRVRVRNAAGEPLAGVAVDMWNESGHRYGTTMSGTDGRLLLSLPNYNYPSVRLSTDNYLGYVDQVYANISCPAGTSVYRGGCGLSGATPISLPGDDPNASEIVIVLGGDGPIVFGDSFE